MLITVLQNTLDRACRKETITVPESHLATLGDPKENSWWQKIAANGVDHFRLRSEAIDDIWIICDYAVT